MPRSSHPIVACCAASAGQVAREKPAYENGVFTQHLIDALKGAATECPQEVLRLDGLVKYVSERCLAEPAPFAQSPSWRPLDAELRDFAFTDVPVAMYDCDAEHPEHPAGTAAGGVTARTPARARSPA